MKTETTQNCPILFLQHDSIFETYGGVQYYIDDLLQFISQTYGKESLKVLLAYRKKELLLAPRDYQIESVRLEQGLMKSLSNRFSPSYFFKALKLCSLFKPKIIIASHLSLAPLAFLISKLTSTPFFVVAYGFEVWGKFQPQDKWALKKANGIISISHWTKTILEKQGFDPRVISVVHPSISPQLIESPNKTFQTTESHPLKLLTVSRLDSAEQYKGHDHVLQALKQIKMQEPQLEFSYTIQGNGDDIPRLKNLVTSLKLDSWVTFMPAVTHREDLKKSYLSHDVFVMPSRFGFWGQCWRGEGFGIVYVEAAILGLPSIAYRCGGAMDIIEDKKTGLLVEPDNIESLAKAILDLAKDRQKLKSLGNNARKAALNRFTPEKVKLELKEAFSLYPFLDLQPTLS